MTCLLSRLEYALFCCDVIQSKASVRNTKASYAIIIAAKFTESPVIERQYTINQLV